MTPCDPQAATMSDRQAEMKTLRCPSPTCNARLLRYRANIDLPIEIEIEIKCRTCSRRQKRGVYHIFVISYLPAEVT